VDGGFGSEIDRERVLASQRQRWEFLHYLYKANLEMPFGQVQAIPATDVGKAIGVIDDREVDRIITYLKDAGLIRFMTFGPTVGITSAGIDEVERALAEPAKPTSYFAPINVIAIAGGVHGSQIQQNAHSSTQTTTLHDFSRKAGPFERFIMRGPRTVIPADPWMLHARVSSQQAVFLCPGNLSESFLENLTTGCVDSEKHVTKFELTGGWRVEALRRLRLTMNISHASLFAGLDGFARSLRHYMIARTPAEDLHWDSVEAAIHGFLYR
jgi:hypothetical protein